MEGLLSKPVFVRLALVVAPLLVATCAAANTTTTATVTAINATAAPTPASASASLSWKGIFTIAVIAVMLVVMALNVIGSLPALYLAAIIFYLSGIISATDFFAGFVNKGMLAIAMLFVIIHPLATLPVVRRVTAIIISGEVSAAGRKPSKGRRSYGARVRAFFALVRLCVFSWAVSPFLENIPHIALMTPAVFATCMGSGGAPAAARPIKDDNDAKHVATEDHPEQEEDEEGGGAIDPRLMLMSMMLSVVLSNFFTIGSSSNLIIEGLVAEYNAKQHKALAASSRSTDHLEEFGFFELAKTNAAVSFALLAYTILWPFVVLRDSLPPAEQRPKHTDSNPRLTSAGGIGAVNATPHIRFPAEEEPPTAASAPTVGTDGAVDDVAAVARAVAANPFAFVVTFAVPSHDQGESSPPKVGSVATSIGVGPVALLRRVNEELLQGAKKPVPHGGAQHSAGTEKKKRLDFVRLLRVERQGCMVHEAGDNADHNDDDVDVDPVLRPGDRLVVAGTVPALRAMRITHRLAWVGIASGSEDATTITEEGTHEPTTAMPSTGSPTANTTTNTSTGSAAGVQGRAQNLPNGPSLWRFTMAVVGESNPCLGTRLGDGAFSAQYDTHILCCRPAVRAALPLCGDALAAHVLEAGDALLLRTRRPFGHATSRVSPGLSFSFALQPSTTGAASDFYITEEIDVGLPAPIANQYTRVAHPAAAWLARRLLVDTTGAVGGRTFAAKVLAMDAITAPPTAPPQSPQTAPPSEDVFVRVPAWYTNLPLAVFAGVTAAAMADVPLQMAAAVGVVALVGLGLVTPRECIAFVDWPVYVTGAFAFCIGSAMTSSGLAAFIASELLNAGLKGFPLLLVLTFVTGAIANVISNRGAIQVMFPIATSLFAQRPGESILPAAVVIASGAMAAFVTPYGLSPSLIIAGPGRYTPGDFLRFGGPLFLLYCTLTALMTSAVYDYW